MTTEPITAEHLDAIRDRHAEAMCPRSSWSYALASARDVPELIAEIERLRATNANLIRNAEVLADELVLGTGDLTEETAR